MLFYRVEFYQSGLTGQKVPAGETKRERAVLGPAAHKSRDRVLSELYSHLHEELEIRLAEAERVEYGFDLPKPFSSECGNIEPAPVVAPNAPRKSIAESAPEGAT
jgi:hypothetical protein